MALRVKTAAEFKKEHGTGWRNSQDWDKSLDSSLGVFLTAKQIVELKRYGNVETYLSQLVPSDIVEDEIPYYPSMVTNIPEAR